MVLELSLHVETQTTTHYSQYDNSILTVTSLSVFHSVVSVMLSSVSVTLFLFLPKRWSKE